MRAKRRYGTSKLLITIFHLALAGPIFGATDRPSNTLGGTSFYSLKRNFTTDAYRRVAIETLIDDVNQLVNQLQLPETVPVRATDLVQINIEAPFFAQQSGAFGCITTKHYRYCASVAGKLSFLSQNISNVESDRKMLRLKYAAPLSELNTNRAHALATQWLASAGVDIQALEKDSKVDIQAWTIGSRFVPLYRVRWIQPLTTRIAAMDPDITSQPVATIELVEPEHLLRLLRIDKAEYILRKPLSVPGRDSLLQQSPDLRAQRMWLTTSAYRRAAIEALLQEANAVGPNLRLTERFPIIQDSLTESIIETPFFADHEKSFGVICTKDYVYGANVGNKLSYIRINFRERDESKYLTRLKEKYSLPMSQINTQAAYNLATQWLRAVSADVKAIERDCQLEISPWEVGSRFVPLYHLGWLKDGNSAATVEVFLPDATLQLLRIDKPEYLLGPELKVPMREMLLSTTNRIEERSR